MEALARRWDAFVAWLMRHRAALVAVAATAALWTLMLVVLWPEPTAEESLCDAPAASVAELVRSTPGEVPGAETARLLAEVDAVCDAHRARQLRSEVTAWLSTPAARGSCEEASATLDELIAQHQDPKMSDAALVEASAAAMAAIVDNCDAGVQADAADAIAAWMADQEPVLPPELEQGGDTP